MVTEGVACGSEFRGLREWVGAPSEDFVVRQSDRGELRPAGPRKAVSARDGVTSICIVVDELQNARERTAVRLP